MALTDEGSGSIPATMLVGPTGFGGGMPYPVYGGGNSMYYYEGGEDFAEQMKELMEDAPNEQVKQRMRQLMQDMQQM
jgi:hypothetical protein